MPERVTGSWQVYAEAQKGLCALASAYDHVVASALCAASAHCAWEQKTVDRLRENTSKQLRAIIAQYALKHENLDQLDVFALGQVVVYLIQQKESRPLLRSICEEQGLRYNPQDETLLRNLGVRAVARLLADFETLRAPKCPFDDVVESAICAASVHCGWEQQTVERLRDDTSQQLRGVIAQHAQKHENLDQLGVFALEQVVGYLIERRESHLWQRYVCHDLEEHPEPRSESPPCPEQKQVVDRAVQTIPKDHPTPLALGASGAWASVRAVYRANAINVFTPFLLGKCRQLIKKFQIKVTPFCEAGGVPTEDVEQILRSGFAQAMVRYEPGRSRCNEDAERIDPAFLTTALRGMQNVFWTDPEILRGCHQDLFRLIGVILNRVGFLQKAAAGRQPAHEEIIANLFNQLRKKVSANQVKKRKKVSASQVKNALAVARTMQFESLVAMAQQYRNDQGTSDIDPFAEGLDALEAARAGCASFPDPVIGVIWNLQRLLVQAAAGRQPTPEEIATLINPFGGFKNKPVIALKVENALAVARTMQFESLVAMAQQYRNDQGTSDIDLLAEGPIALNAAKAGCASFPDPANEYESKDFVMKFEALAKQILSPQEEDVFGLRSLDTDKSWAEIAAEMGVTERQAQELYRRAKNKLSADPRVNQLRLSTMDTH